MMRRSRHLKLVPVLIMSLAGCAGAHDSGRSLTPEPVRPTAGSSGDQRKVERTEERMESAEESGQDESRSQGAEQDGGELVYARIDAVPRFVLAGKPIKVPVRISLPSPAWTWRGFTVRQEKGIPPRVVISPRAAPPAPGVIAPQVLVNREKSAVVGVLPVGEYLVRVESRGEEMPHGMLMTVIPSRVTACLHLQGGIAALDRHILVSEDGTVVLWSRRQPRQRTVRIPAERLRVIRELVVKLPEKPVSKHSKRGADLMGYELAWRVKKVLRQVSVDDGTANGPIEQMIGVLSSLWVEPPR